MNRSKKLLFTHFLVSLFFFSLYPLSSQSQEIQQWVRQYNGPANSFDAAKGITVDSIENVYVTGYGTGISTSKDITTIKYNTLGVQQWVAIYNGIGNSSIEYASDIAVDKNGNSYVTGNRYDGGASRTYFVTLKYNSSGAQQWVRIFKNDSGDVFSKFIEVDGSGNVYVCGNKNLGYTVTIKYNSNGDSIWTNYCNIKPNDFSSDKFGNVYVTGGGAGFGYGVDFATIKYTSSGGVEWIHSYDRGYEDFATSLEIDSSGNIYVTGYSRISSYTYDGMTIKYNTSGNIQWVHIYDEGEQDFLNAIATDDSGNVYVTGYSYWFSHKMITLKYNSSGNLQWIKKYSDPIPSINEAYSIAVDDSGNIFVGGYSGSGIAILKYNSNGDSIWLRKYSGENSSYTGLPLLIDKSNNIYFTSTAGSNYQTVKLTPLYITRPFPYTKLISGTIDTIKWSGGGPLNLNIKCVINYATNKQSEFTIAQNIAAAQQQYVWSVPDTLLSFRTKIILENYNDVSQRSESEIFRVKPYLLTRVNPDSTYYEFRKDRDQWGFFNNPMDMFPTSWYNQFNYQGIDPFTGKQYSQVQAIVGPIFADAKNYYFTDWPSWIYTFTTSACYLDLINGIYSPMAVELWDDTHIRNMASEKGKWRGSCFGIATANAIVFRNYNDFQIRYPSFPTFVEPITVDSNGAVRRSINELFTHQFGQPHMDYLKSAITKTPNETLNEIKSMLLSENDSTRVLGILNNSGGGAHAINAYKVTRDISNPEKYYVHVYDNSKPSSLVPITIDTSGNGGTGTWDTPDWPGWGGIDGMFLFDPAATYLDNPELSRDSKTQSPFVLSSTLLQVLNTTDASISIKDQNGNVTGFINNTVQTNITNSFPLTIFDGSETSPYGYQLPIDNYSVSLNNIDNDTVDIDFFTGNKLFSFKRLDATLSQTDYFSFDGGLRFRNTNSSPKTIKLSNIVKESSEEKVYVIKNLNMSQNDSLKIENPDDDRLMLITFGSAKNYDLEMNRASGNGLDRFVNVDINLTANSSHTLVPDWTDITHKDLIVLHDIGNNGTIDDTLILHNELHSVLYLTALIEGFYNNTSNEMKGDTARVYLRNVFSPLAIIDSAKSVLDLNGNGSFDFANVINGVQYYVVVKHRNSIETWSKQGVMFTSNQLTYDFTTSANKAYGDNLKLKGSRYCIFGGDVDQNGLVDAVDLGSIDTDVFYFATGYISSDLDGNNFVDAADMTIVDNNAFNFVSRIRP